MNRTTLPRRLLSSATLVVVGLLVALLAMAVVAGCSDDDTASDEATETTGMAEGQTGPDSVGTVVTTGSGETYVDITPDELAAMLEDKDFLLINTHVPYAGDIPQTDQFIPFDEAAERIDELPEDTSAKIVVYCQSDNMSRQAINVWAEAGYTNLYNLDGGFIAWQDAGYEMVQNEW